MTDPGLPPRHVFVCGLHRSGTSLLARMIAAHPEVSALHAPDVPEGEGAYVQGAIPHTACHGIPGAFAFDPAQHMTEAHPLNRLETRRRLDHDWSPRFDPKCPWRLEKSPVNLLRTRLYQQLFPMAHFIVIVRHPAAVAHATAKWSEAGLDALLHHWEAAHRLFLGDLPYLHAALLLRYEDLVASPTTILRRALRFLDLDPGATGAGPQVFDGNAHYDLHLDDPLPPTAIRLGYRPGRAAPAPLPEALACRHPLKGLRQDVLADA